mmetsp:Transcript_127675/g.355318  ORF Transcript_127675/g.355318 Transcript_127675/m.355318 type:complete len:226 (-) Transcript_127675:212-889(-)
MSPQVGLARTRRPLMDPSSPRRSQWAATHTPPPPREVSLCEVCAWPSEAIVQQRLQWAHICHHHRNSGCPPRRGCLATTVPIHRGTNQGEPCNPTSLEPSTAEPAGRAPKSPGRPSSREGLWNTKRALEGSSLCGSRAGFSRRSATSRKREALAMQCPQTQAACLRSLSCLALGSTSALASRCLHLSPPPTSHSFGRAWATGIPKIYQRRTWLRGTRRLSSGWAA